MTVVEYPMLLSASAEYESINVKSESMVVGSGFESEIEP